jgi:hypothetical protein
LARHLAQIQEQVLHIQARLSQIEVQLQQSQPERPLSLLHGDLGLWAYVALLAAFMSVAFVLQWVWP